jgi:DNA helicase-2/ATP-dependent DNA helicase PcrA
VFLKECVNNLAEASLVATLIRELQERDGLAYPNFAVLFRNWAQGSPVEQALSEQRVPYVLFGDQTHYYERLEVRALYAYLRAILAVAGENQSPPLDGALDLILSAPPRGVGPRSLQLIRGHHPEITWEALVTATLRTDLREQVRRSVAELFELLSRFSRLAGELSPSEMIARVIRETRWELALADELEGKKVLGNLRSFQAEADEYGSLETFVRAMKSKIKSELTGKGVAVSTIHAAKGLEWPAVFVIGLNQGILPSAQSLRQAMHADPVEERHVAHVAFSRARALLFLTWNREQLEPEGRAKPLRPSEFLGRLPQESTREFEAIGDIGRLSPPDGPEDLEPGEGGQFEGGF